MPRQPAYGCPVDVPVSVVGGKWKLVVPPKVVYDIQPAERARLGELLQALCRWGLYWSGKTGARILAFERDTAGSRTA